MREITKQRKYEIKQKAINGKLVVLSLFDGMSGAQIALKELGITPAKYYASEIEKKSIKVCEKNFAETVQVGDVNNWTEWLPKILAKNTIDLIVCGSPCQNFSTLGDKKGLDGEKSKLFFVALDILEHIENFQKKPAYWLFENVVGSDILANYLRTNIIHIDNAVFDAAHRNRLYFTNIAAKYNVDLFDELYCYSTIPSLTDTRPRPFPFDENPDEELFLSEKQMKYYFKFDEPFSDSEKTPVLIVKDEIPRCITRNSGGRLGANIVAQKCSKLNSYKGLGYSFRRLSISELKKCNGIPEWYNFASYSYSSIHELIGNGFGIGSIKYIFGHILK